MSSEIFESILARLSLSNLYGPNLTILWHGGEPLSVPLPFYQRAAELARKAIPNSCDYHFNFQTNGTLITQSFCDFAKEIDAKIGISIDGPAFLTDVSRVYRSGKGISSSLRRGIELLRYNDIEFNAICVLTASSLDYSDEIYEFFVSLGVDHVGFNVEEVEGANVSSSIYDDPVSRIKLFSFFKNIYRRSRREKPGVRFRELDQAESSIRNGTSVFSRLVNPFSIISVTHDGRWSTFAPELLYDQRFQFGDVAETDFADAISDPSFLAAFAEISDGVANCRNECGYFNLCGGGCPSNKVAETGSARATATNHCLYTKKIPINVVLRELELEYGISDSPQIITNAIGGRASN